MSDSGTAIVGLLTCNPAWGAAMDGLIEVTALGEAPIVTSSSSSSNVSFVSLPVGLAGAGDPSSAVVVSQDPILGDFLASQGIDSVPLQELFNQLFGGTGDESDPFSELLAGFGFWDFPAGQHRTVQLPWLLDGRRAIPFVGLQVLVPEDGEVHLASAVLGSLVLDSDDGDDNQVVD